MYAFDHHYVNGAWVAPAAATRIPVINAATEAEMGHVPAGGVADAAAAVAAARAAFANWSQTSPEARADWLVRIQAGLAARKEELARLIACEVGMPLKLSAAIQVGGPIATFGNFARIARAFEWEAPIGNSRVLREAAGVVAAITPWNYPLHQIATKVAAALAAGCTVVLKPSEVAPLNAFVLAQVAHEVGLPAGVFNLVSGTGPAAGQPLVEHPDVDMVSFTGSTQAGRLIGALAAQTVKKVSLELGGKSASVLLPDADLPLAVKSTVNACFLNSGQTCSALTRLLVPGQHYEEAARLAVEAAGAFTVGDPLGGQARLGPLVSAAQRERVRAHIRRAVEEGAELLIGGAEPPEGLPTGYYVRPTVFGRVRPESALAQEEVFGPVLAIIPYRDEADALAIANGTQYGLAGAVWSADTDRAVAFARRMRTGQVDINGGPFNMLAPFGGYKQSGIGRELGRYGLEEFLECKSLQFKPQP